MTVEHFRNDLSSFWNHANFFIVIQGALAAVFANLLGSENGSASQGLISVRQEAILLTTIGLFFALFWGWVALRRKVLIQAWRAQVLHLDGLVDRHGVYLRIEPSVGGRWWYGPTAFTASLPWFLAAAWLAALVWLAGFAG